MNGFPLLHVGHAFPPAPCHPSQVYSARTQRSRSPSPQRVSASAPSSIAAPVMARSPHASPYMGARTTAVASSAPAFVEPRATIPGAAPPCVQPSPRVKAVAQTKTLGPQKIEGVKEFVEERDAITARCTALREHLNNGGPLLQQLLYKAEEAEHLKREFGQPLLHGAVITTQARTAQLRQESANYQRMAQRDSELASQAAAHTAAAAQVAPRSRTEAEVIVSHLEAAESVRDELRQQISRLLNEESQLLAVAATENELLSREEEDLRERLARNHMEAASLREHAGKLRMQRVALEETYSLAKATEMSRYTQLFGDLRNSPPSRSSVDIRGSPQWTHHSDISRTWSPQVLFDAGNAPSAGGILNDVLLRS